MALSPAPLSTPAASIKAPGYCSTSSPTATHYLTVRANPLENNLLLWKFEKGRRSSVKWIRNTPTASHEWHDLRLQMLQRLPAIDGGQIKLHVPHLLAVTNGEEPEPVVLDLVNPLRPGRHCPADRWQARFNEAAKMLARIVPVHSSLLAGDARESSNSSSRWPVLHRLSD
jgi:hypothetical protein